MPLAEITIVAGRSAQKKRTLMTMVTDAIAASLDAPRDAIRVVIREIPVEHWAVGGVPISDRRKPDEMETG